MKGRHGKTNYALYWGVGAVACCAVIAVVLLTVFGGGLNRAPAQQTDGGNGTMPSTAQTTGTTQPREPYKVSSATILSTGDIMVHDPQLNGAKVPGKEEWDFGAFFKEVGAYFKAADFSVANLETTFAGNENRKYAGYPSFNTPDSLADAIKEAGLSMVLTSNNHSYDTGFSGLKRTQEVLREKGITYTGTRLSEDEAIFTVQEINGIRVGMATFTYETGRTEEGLKTVNGIPVKKEAGPLLNSFSYNDLDGFYAVVDEVLTDMKAAGAEVTMLYMHWGDEYQTTENSWQNTIAQTLCDKGVDVIVGGHPHVVQPMELLKSADGEHQTVCLYSAGNAVSNQRQERMDSCPSGHTEDGLLLYCTFDKYSDGKVVLSDVDVIPTWVDKYPGGSGYQYTIYPLENANDGAEKYGLTGTAATKSKKSYERTKEIIAPGLTECQTAIGCPITFADAAGE